MSKYALALLVLAGVLEQTMAQLVSAETNTIAVDFSEAVDEDAAIEMPSIAWLFPTTEYTNSQDRKVVFKSVVKSSTPLSSVEIRLSKSKGGTAMATKQLEVPENSYMMEVDQELFLQNGENVIEVVAINEEGGQVMDYRNVLVGFDAISKAIDINRKDYALMIGTDKYDHWTDLVNPIFDTETIGEELEDIYGFETEYLQNPEQEELLIKLKEYAVKEYRPQDQLIIFVAGHGQFDEAFGEGYLVTRGSLRNDDAKTSYIAHSNLRTIINNIPCEHILLVMDVCFSGTFDPVIASSRAAGYEEIDDAALLVRKLSKTTRRYLTSGGKEYVSDGVPGRHSPFAQRFLEVLRSRGGNDRIITLTEIYPTMQRLQTLPRTGEFGSNEPDSDFVFVVK
ncbi:MAG: caspase family protein [Bacteroidota bacterium]